MRQRSGYLVDSTLGAASGALGTVGGAALIGALLRCSHLRSDQQAREDTGERAQA
jgi:hypothetical protein